MKSDPIRRDPALAGQPVSQRAIDGVWSNICDDDFIASFFKSILGWTNSMIKRIRADSGRAAAAAAVAAAAAAVRPPSAGLTRASDRHQLWGRNDESFLASSNRSQKKMHSGYGSILGRDNSSSDSGSYILRKSGSSGTEACGCGPSLGLRHAEFICLHSRLVSLGSCSRQPFVVRGGLNWIQFSEMDQMSKNLSSLVGEWLNQNSTFNLHKICLFFPSNLTHLRQSTQKSRPSFRNKKLGITLIS